MLSTRAIALESGAKGETIRVRNLNSRKVIEVTVTTAGGGEIKPLHLAARS
jgi:flagella basal body P-ring formation protein FlgA